jgi:plastocyanin
MSEAKSKPGSILFLGLLLLALPLAGYFLYPILNPPLPEEGKRGSLTDEVASAPEPRRSLIPPPGKLGSELDRDAGFERDASIEAGSVEQAGLPNPTPDEIARLPRLEVMLPAAGGMPMGTQAPSYTPGVMFVAGEGVISGVVRYGGSPIQPKKIDMKTDAACKRQNPAGEWTEIRVNDGRLEGALVDVVESGIWSNRFPVRSEEVVLDQRGCVYEPRMVALQTGQTLVIRNSDPTLHNVHGLLKRGEFNQAMPKQGSEIRKTFPRSNEWFDVKCEVHSWMEATVATVNHPYFALTAADGTFRIEGLPPEKYVLRFYYPGLGEVRKEVELTAVGAVLNVELK